MEVKPSSETLGSVLVVGGCGFLGHHIVNQLVDLHRTSRIAVLDINTTRYRQPDSSNVQYYEADISSSDSVLPIFEKFKPEVVIHTASPPANIKASNALLRKVNVEGTKTLVEVAAKSGAKAFVYTSSASVILDGKSNLINSDERWPYVPLKKQMDYYTQTKSEAEQCVLAATRAHNDMLTVALRPAGLFGEGDMQMVPKMLEVYRQGRSAFQLGDNENLFDYTYIGNAAHAHVLAAAALLRAHGAAAPPAEAETRVDGEAFFITNDAPIYFWDFPRAIWAVAGDRTPLSAVWHLSADTALVLATVLEAMGALIGKTLNPSRVAVGYATRTRYHSCIKAKMRLRYEPTVGLEEGIRRSVRWFEREEQREREKKKQ